jgi:glutaredoxin
MTQRLTSLTHAPTVQPIPRLQRLQAAGHALMSVMLSASLLWGSGSAWALYKVVGPDGRITYTDRLPHDQPARALKANGASVATESLPYELQKVVARFPVILYTGSNCTPCDAGRQLLKSRGVPFTEKTVISEEDIRQFRSRESTDQLPTVRIGQKQLSGLQHNEWTAYLDAAGYPARSALPPNYQYAAPSPLVSVDVKSSGASSAPQSAQGTTPIAPISPVGNTPAGIRF